MDTPYHCYIRLLFLNEHFRKFEAIGTVVSRHINDSNVWGVEKGIPIMKNGMLLTPNMTFYKKRFGNGPKKLFNTVYFFCKGKNTTCKISYGNLIIYILQL